MIPASVFVIVMSLATGTYQASSGCRESNFPFNGECLPCPDHCIKCSSNTNCTKCTDNYYGVTCQQTCHHRDCECHKTYGYCTYGCPDGSFPVDYSAECPICPGNCELCSSSSDCVLCKHRFFGNMCEQPCPTHCEACNKNSGICITCLEGYYNQDGLCLKCPDGCVSCHDSKNCSRCTAGYLEPDNGHCLNYCEVIDSDTFPSLNGQNEIDTETQGGTACGCEKNLIGHDVKIRTRQPCIRFTSCPSTLPCLKCGAIMTYRCTHTCHLESEQSCRCKSECNFIEWTMCSLSFCLDIKGAVSVKNITRALECVAEDVTNVPLVVVGVLGTFCIVVAVAVIIRWKRKRIVMWFRNDTEARNTKPLLKLHRDHQRESDTPKPELQAPEEHQPIV